MPRSLAARRKPVSPRRPREAVTPAIRRPCVTRGIPGTAAAPGGAAAAGTTGYARHRPPVCTWNAARRAALARAGSGWTAASATSTCTVRG